MIEPLTLILTGTATLGCGLFMLYVGSSAFAPLGPELTAPVMVGMCLFGFVNVSRGLKLWRSKRARDRTPGGKR